MKTTRLSLDSALVPGTGAFAHFLATIQSSKKPQPLTKTVS